MRSKQPPTIRVAVLCCARGSLRVAYSVVLADDVGMLQRFSQTIPISTVQQEINLLVRPSAASVNFCAKHGCSFIAYAPAILWVLVVDEFCLAPAVCTALTSYAANAGMVPCSAAFLQTSTSMHKCRSQTPRMRNR